MWYYFQFIEEKVELKKANELTNFTKLGKKIKVKNKSFDFKLTAFSILA